jgi:hypothetical protein
MAPLADVCGQALLYLHVHHWVEMVAQWFLYVVQWKSPPWSYCKILDEGEDSRRESLAEFRLVWSTILRLENSGLPEHKPLLDTLFFNQWPTFREPMLLWELGNFAWSDRAYEYVKAMFPEYATSLPLEQTINALRDNERRGATQQASKLSMHHASTFAFVRVFNHRTPALRVAATGPSGVGRNLRPNPAAPHLLSNHQLPMQAFSVSPPQESRLIRFGFLRYCRSTHATSIWRELCA